MLSRLLACVFVAAGSAALADAPAPAGWEGFPVWVWGGGDFRGSTDFRPEELTMWEKTLPQRLILIGVVLLIGIWLITPPSEKLRGGLDIEGGVSMIFEIQEEEGESDPYLAERMKRLLQRRVDPRGVYDLKWRTLGHNRLEVQMPLPPEENKQLREEFITAREALLATNIKRSDLENALRMTGDEREDRIRALAVDSAERERLLREAATAHDEYSKARQALQAAEQAEDEPVAEDEPEAEEGPPADTQPTAQP